MNKKTENSNTLHISQFVFRKYFWQVLILAVVIDWLFRLMANIFRAKLENYSIPDGKFGVDKLFITHGVENRPSGFEGLIDAISSSWNQNYVIEACMWIIQKGMDLLNLETWSVNSEKYLVVFLSLFMLSIVGFLMTKGTNRGFRSKVFITIFALTIAGFTCNLMEVYRYGHVTYFLGFYDVQNNLLGALLGFIGFPYQQGTLNGYYNVADIYLLIANNLTSFIVIFATAFYLTGGFKRFLSGHKRGLIENLGIPHNRQVPKNVREEVFDIDQGKCRFCGSCENLQFDHIIPFSKGGSSKDAKNIQLLCVSCNRKKGSDF